MGILIYLPLLGCNLRFYMVLIICISVIVSDGIFRLILNIDWMGFLKMHYIGRFCHTVPRMSLQYPLQTSYRTKKTGVTSAQTLRVIAYAARLSSLEKYSCS